MQISKVAMALLLSRLQVFPAFVNILSGFALQTNESPTATTGFSSFYGGHSLETSSMPNHFRFHLHSHLTTNFSLAFETAYVLKYIDLNGRPGTDPWSIRQMAIYQNFNISNAHSDNLLIRSSDQVQKRISDLVHSKSINTLPTHWTNMHSVYLGTLNHNWGVYISWIDTLISQVDFDYFFTKVNGEVPNRLHFEDLQQLNKGIDVLSQMAQALTLNIEVLTLLSQEAARRASIEGGTEKGRYEVFQQDTRTSITEQSFFKRRVGLLQAFADRRSVQVSYSPVFISIRFLFPSGKMC